MTDLVNHLQMVVLALKKNSGNWSSMLVAINRYWEQALYNWFKNFDKLLGSNKFFCNLRIVVRQYKSKQMLATNLTFNNIIAHKLLTICHGILLDSYRH